MPKKKFQTRSATIAAARSVPAKREDENTITCKYPIFFDIQPNIERGISIEDAQLKLKRSEKGIEFFATGTTESNAIQPTLNAWRVGTMEPLKFFVLDEAGKEIGQVITHMLINGKQSPGHLGVVAGSKINNRAVVLSFDKVAAFAVERKVLSVILDDGGSYEPPSWYIGWTWYF